MKSPSPVPETSRFEPLSPRKNFVKRRDSSVSETPTPVSETVIFTTVPETSAETVTVVPAGEYLHALLRRLQITWERRSLSAQTVKLGPICVTRSISLFHDLLFHEPEGSGYLKPSVQHRGGELQAARLYSGNVQQVVYQGIEPAGVFPDGVQVPPLPLAKLPHRVLCVEANRSV